MSDENALIQIAEANVPTLPETMNTLWDTLEKTAARNIQTSASDQGADLEAFSAIELRSLLYTEMLNLSKGLGFAEIMTQGRILSTMERESLHSVHPGGYRTLEELAQDQGISVSELSQIRDLTQTVFPWVEDKMGVAPAYLWDEVGKSNLREMVPLLKRIISDEESRGSVENSYEALSQDVVATYLSANPDSDPPEGEDLQVMMAETLIENGVNLTNANLRQTIRPDRTDSIEPVVLRRFSQGMGENQLYVVMKVTEDQMTMLERRLHGYWDPVRTTATNRGDVESIRLIRELLEG